MADAVGTEYRAAVSAESSRRRGHADGANADWPWESRETDNSLLSIARRESEITHRSVRADGASTERLGRGSPTVSTGPRPRAD